MNVHSGTRWRYSKSSGGLKSAAYAAVDERFIKLYELLEATILGRGQGSGGVSADSSVTNGGFEAGDDRGLASGWKKAQ